MMRAARKESEGRHQLKITDESLAGSEGTAHRVFLDIEDVIFCNLKFKKCFIGHSSIVLAVMRRLSSSFCIQATGCRVTGASKVVFEGTLDGSRRVAVLQMKPGAASLDQEASMMLKLLG